MDSPHQKKTSLSGHENHGVYLCRRCGWPFPNPHPNAKHRRAHKRICGNVEGYKLTDSEEHAHLSVSDDEHLSDEDRHNSGPNIEKSSSKEHAHLAVSDDEHLSDEDRHNSGRNIEKRSSEEFTSGGVGERSNRSEYEVFSDAAAEFSDSGYNSGFEGRVEGVRELDKNVEKIVDVNLDSSQSPKVNANADVDTAHPPNSLTDTCEVKNPEVLERATNQLGATTAVQQTVSSCSDSMETDVKGNEENDVDKIFSDDVAFPTSNIASKESEADSKLLVMVEKTSDPVIADGIVEPKEEQSDGLEPKMSKGDDSCEAESVEHMEAFRNTVQVEEVSGRDRDVGMHGCLVEGCNTKEEGNENMHVLLVANDLALVDHPEIMIEDFKDHKAVKSNIPLTLGSGEVTKSLDDGNKDTVHESDSSSYSSKPGECLNISSTDINALEENPKQEGGGNQHTIEVPAQGEADILKVKVMSSDDIGSSGVEDPLGTIRTEANQCLEGMHPQFSDSDSSRNILIECNAKDLSDTIHMVAPVDGKVNCMANLSGGDNADDHETDKIEKCDTDGNQRSERVVEEELPASVKTPPEFLDNISLSEADQIFNSLGQDSAGSSEMAGNEFFDVAGSGSRKTIAEEKCVMNANKSPESESQFSESQVVSDNGVAITVRSLEETESNHLDRVSDSSKDGIGTTDLGNMMQPHSNSRNCLDEDYKEAIKKLENDNEVPVESVGAVGTVAGLNLAGDVEVPHRNSGDFNLKEPEPLPVDSEYITKSSDNVEDNQGRNAGGGVSGVSSDLLGEGDNLTKQHVGVSAVDISVDSSSQTASLEAIKKLENNNDSEVPVESVGAVSTAAELNRAGDVEVSHRNSGDFNSKEPEPSAVDSEFITKSSDNVEDNQGRNAGGGSGVSSDLLGEGDNNLTKQHVGVSAVDFAVDSSSQTDSLEGNWGSVSVLSIQSDAPAAVETEALPSTDSLASEQSEKGNLKQPKSASKGHHSEKSDAFEAPSFMTLVESGSEIDQKVASSEIHVQDTQQSKSEALKAGWFPTLTNVVNESQGRKKNEEVIAKVTNWSTGKQHIPLKSLLGEANHETKPKSPNTKPSPTVIQNDETAAKNNGASVPRSTTVNSILGPEAPTDQAAGKAWNSPARYPTDNKKEKRKIKGKPYWVPFVCCSSVN